MTDKIIPMVVGGFCHCCLLPDPAGADDAPPEGDAIFADKEVAGEDADAPYGLWSTLAWFAGICCR